MRKFYRNIADMAWTETVKALHLNSGFGFMTWVAGTVAALAGLAFWGSADASHDEIIVRAFVGAALLGMIPFVFAWKFVGTIPKSHYYMRDWIKELEGAIIGSQDKDAAVIGISERFNAGMKIFRSKSKRSLSELEAWEVSFDEYIKSHFEYGFFHQICVVSHIDYTVVNDGVTIRTFENDKPHDQRAYFAEKLNKINNMIPYAGTYYKGTNVKSLFDQHLVIRRYGLPEHQSPLGIEQKKQP